MIDLPSVLRLYLVADPEHCHGELVEMVESAITGGVTIVQLRAKQLSDLEHVNLAKRVGTACRSLGVPFLVNDRVDIALAASAEGVHLGVDDLPLEDARSIGGQGFLIGYSPETDEQLISADGRGADYLGIGPIFGTSTKPDAGSALGLETFESRVRLANIPVVGIGGITVSNAEFVLDAGATGVAVVSAILNADNPHEAARQLSRNS